MSESVQRPRLNCPHSTKLPIASLRSAPPGVQSLGDGSTDIAKPTKYGWNKIMINKCKHNKSHEFTTPKQAMLNPGALTTAVPVTAPRTTLANRHKPHPVDRPRADRFLWSAESLHLSLEMFGESVNLSPYSLSPNLSEALKSKAVWIYCKILLGTFIAVLTQKAKICYFGSRPLEPKLHIN